MIQPTITLHLTCGQCIEINPKYIVDYHDRTDKNGNVIGSWLSTTNRELGDSREIKESREEILKLIKELPDVNEQIINLLIEINYNIKKLTDSQLYTSDSITEIGE